MTGVASTQERPPAEAGVLKALFPADCAVAAMTEPGHDSDLYDDEADHIADACASRRAEFAAGRFCARQAFRALGAPPYAVMPDRHRAPVWPHGLVGSIAHCPGLCAAIVARRPFRRAVGLDVEINDRLDAGLRDVVATPMERADWGRLGNVFGCDPFKLLFVVKEALFKLYFPATRHFLDFHDVAARADPANGTFSAEIVDAAAPSFGRAQLFSGRYGVTDGFVMAGLVA